MPQKFFLAMDTLCMGYECFFQKFTRWQLLSLLISTVSILQILIFEVFFSKLFYQYSPYWSAGVMAIQASDSDCSFYNGGRGDSLGCMYEGARDRKKLGQLSELLRVGLFLPTLDQLYFFKLHFINFNFQSYVLCKISNFQLCQLFKFDQTEP